MDRKTENTRRAKNLLILSSQTIIKMQSVSFDIHIAEVLHTIPQDQCNKGGIVKYTYKLYAFGTPAGQFIEQEVFGNYNIILVLL